MATVHCPIIAAAGLALALSAGPAAPALEQVLSTSAGRSGNPWNGVAVQHFTVPYGCTATKVEFRCDTSRARHLPDHTVVLQLYSADRQCLATGGAAASLFAAAPNGLAVEQLSLAAGEYYAQMFSNSQALQPLLQAHLANRN